jgi:hypothetical protein
MNTPTILNTLSDLYLNTLAADSPYGPIHSETLLNLLSVTCSDKTGTEFGLHLTPDNFDGHTPRFLTLLESANLAYQATISYNNYGPDGRTQTIANINEDGSITEEQYQDTDTDYWLHIATGQPEAVSTLIDHGGWHTCEDHHQNVIADFLGIPESQRQDTLHGKKYQDAIRERLDNETLTETDAAKLTMYLNYSPRPTPEGINEAIDHANKRDTDIRTYATEHHLDHVTEFLNEIHQGRHADIESWF